MIIKVCGRCWWTLSNQKAKRPICLECKKQTKVIEIDINEIVKTTREKFLISEIYEKLWYMRWEIIRSIWRNWIVFTSKYSYWALPWWLWRVWKWYWRNRVFEKVPELIAYTAWTWNHHLIIDFETAYSLVTKLFTWDIRITWTRLKNKNTLTKDQSFKVCLSFNIYNIYRKFIEDPIAFEDANPEKVEYIYESWIDIKKIAHIVNESSIDMDYIEDILELWIWDDYKRYEWRFKEYKKRRRFIFKE